VSTSEQRQIAAPALSGVQLLDIVGPLEAFNLASQKLLDDNDARGPAYHPVVIAKQCGFGNADNMRHAFVRELDVTPSAYRQRFGNR
jgi:AraC-like DNA-binding protein